MPHWKIVVLVLVLGVAGWMLTMFILSAMAWRPGGLGVKDGRLAACPGTPNCVQSQDADAGHAIEPLAFRGDADEAWDRLKDVLSRRPRTKIVAETDTYMHTECKSLIFGFVDDVEFLLDREGQCIHVRSASRAGRSDLGVNRHRVEQIRQAFAAK